VKHVKYGVCVCACACTEYMRDAYEQPERLMLVHKADADDHVTLASGTLAKLSPPTKRTGCCQSVFIC